MDGGREGEREKGKEVREKTALEGKSERKQEEEQNVKG